MEEKSFRELLIRQLSIGLAWLVHVPNRKGGQDGLILKALFRSRPGPEHSYRVKSRHLMES